MNDILSQHIIMVGPSGSGKSTIGSKLAARLSWNFFDAEDFYSSDHIHTMMQGKLLNDKDEVQLLNDITLHITKLHHRRLSSVLACPCLTQRHRTIFADLEKKSASIHILFMHLAIDLKTALKRTKKRKVHFLSHTLVKKQFDILEFPSEDEKITYSIIHAQNKDIEFLVDECMQIISR